MRFVKFLLAAITVIVVGMVGLVYLAPEKATIFAINADRHRLLRFEYCNGFSFTVRARYISNTS